MGCLKSSYCESSSKPREQADGEVGGRSRGKIVFAKGIIQEARMPIKSCRLDFEFI